MCDTRTIRASVLLVVAVVAARSAQGQMQVELDRERVYIGTRTLLHVAVSGSDDSWPAVAEVDGLTIEPYGKPGLRIDPFRGRRSRVYQFLVTPARPGSYTIPTVTVRVEGKPITRGPLTLEAIEAPLRFVRIELDEPMVVVGETTTLAVTYQGVHSANQLVVPKVAGLTLSAARGPELSVTRDEGMPLSTFTLTVRPTRIGRFTIAGIALDGKTAKPITLRAERFVVLGVQAGERSLVVGGLTRVNLFIKGLTHDPGVRLVVGSQLTSTTTTKPYPHPRRPDVTVFTFDVTAVEPGEVTIASFTLPDKTTVEIPKPITISIRQAGKSGIFACRATPRKQETVVGEPVVVDFEVLFRGDLRSAALHLADAPFAKRDYITLESATPIDDPDWQGTPFALRVGNGQIEALLGSGTVDGGKEQMIRFALKITSLATGELSLEGMQIALGIQVSETRRTANSFFSSSRTEQLTRKVEVPPHRVIDPPGVTRPALYRGAVGRLSLETELDRTTATAMSPMTLTLRMRGEGVNSHLAPPPIDQVTELVRDFEVASTVSGGDVTDDVIEFTQVIRPRNESVKELPALPLVYYDYKARKYETVYSLPVAIEVNPGTLVGASALQVAANGTPTTSVDVDAEPVTSSTHPAGADLGANFTTLGDLTVVEPMRPATLVATLVGGPAVVLFAYGTQSLLRRRRPAATRRQASRSVRDRLDQLAASPRFFSDLADTLGDYLRSRLDLPSGEISPSRLADALTERGADRDLPRAWTNLLIRCDTGRFGTSAPTETDQAEMLASARGLLDELDRVTR